MPLTRAAASSVAVTSLLNTQHPNTPAPGAHLPSNQPTHLVTPAQLVNLVDQHKRVAAARGLQALNHLARHRTHISATVACRGERVSECETGFSKLRRTKPKGTASKRKAATMVDCGPCTAITAAKRCVDRAPKYMQAGRPAQPSRPAGTHP